MAQRIRRNQYPSPLLEGMAYYGGMDDNDVSPELRHCTVRHPTMSLQSSRT